jgi:predicted CXXCH cytochrome family protein
MRADTGAVRPPGEVCALGRVNRQETTAQTCIACHDGTVASVSLAAAPGAHDAHPVDVSYDAATLRNGRLHRRFDVSRALALPAGKVTCVTCHDGASEEPMHTALPMSGSRMCLSCHDI